MFDRIKLLCKQNGISIAALERKLHFANGSIAKTDNKTQIGRIKAIADFFGVTIEYLMTGTQANEFILSEEERRLICAYRQATDDRREAVRLLLDFPATKDVQATEPYSA